VCSIEEGESEREGGCLDGGVDIWVLCRNCGEQVLYNSQITDSFIGMKLDIFTIQPINVTLCLAMLYLNELRDMN